MAKLKLLKPSKVTEESSNFWNTCPRELEYFPEKICSKAISQKEDEEPECPWWVNSQDHHNCFWTYIRNKSSNDGFMEELSQSDISKLFGWSSVKTQTMMNEAMDALVQVLETYDLSDILADSDDHLDETYAKILDSDFDFD